MRSRLPQQNLNLPLLAAVLTMILCTLPFAGKNPLTVNYTGLFSAAPAITWLCMGPALILLSWLYCSVICSVFPKQQAVPILVLLFLGVIALMLIPYRKETDMSTNIHLILAAVELTGINLVLFPCLLRQPQLLQFYTAGLILALFTALCTSSINGLAELIYAYLLILTLYMYKKDRP